MLLNIFAILVTNYFAMLATSTTTIETITQSVALVIPSVNAIATIAVVAISCLQHDATTCKILGHLSDHDHALHHHHCLPHHKLPPPTL